MRSSIANRLGDAGWRRRIVGAIGGIALLALVLWLGGVLLGASEGFGRTTPAGALALDRSIPSITRSDSLEVRGTTRAGSAVTASVDGVEVETFATGPDGQFAFVLPVAGLGVHEVRIAVSYRGLKVDELFEASVRRVGDAVPEPQLLSVERWPELRGFYLMLRAEPGTVVTAVGGDLEALGRDLAVGPTGRSHYFMATPTAPVQLIATDPEGHESKPTPPMDLAEVAGTVLELPEFERVEAEVVFHIRRSGVTRQQTVTLAPERPELGQLTTGSIEAPAFIEEVAGPAGLAPVDVPGCVVSNVQDARAEIKIAAKATVAVTDAFPSLLSQWNGFTDTPRVSLCFPFGMPSRRDTGAVEVRLRDYVFGSVSQVPDAATVEVLEDGNVERVYRWDRVPFRGRIDLTLAAESPSLFRLLPRATSERVKDTNEGFLPFLGDLVGAFVQAAGIVLLLTIVTSTLGAGFRSARGRLRISLIVGLAIAIAPAIGQLNALAQGLATVAEVVEIAVDTGADVAFVAGAAVAIGTTMVAIGGWAFSRAVKWPLGGALSLAVAVGALGWFALSTTVTVVTDQFPTDIAAEMVRVRAWLIGMGAVTVVLAAIGLAFPRPNDATPVALRLLSIIPWALAGGAILALPAGTDGRIIGSGQAASFVESVVERLVLLAAYATPLLALAALVAAIRTAWSLEPWHLVHLERRIASRLPGRLAMLSSRLIPALSAVTFAAFGLATTGNLLWLTLLFGVGAFAYMLRPVGELDDSAEAADRALRRRRQLLETALGRPIRSPDDAAPLSDFEARWLDEQRSSSVWSTCRFAIQWTIPLLAPLVVLYLSQFQLTGVNREDPLYAQRALLNLASFITPWLFLSLTFGLAYDYLRGASGLQKGLLLGGATLLVTVPIQLANGIASNLSPLETTLWILEVVTFTVALGILFDIRDLHRQGRFHVSRPRELIQELGDTSGIPQVFTGISILVGAGATAVLTLLSGQVSQVVTRVLAPFLPLPTE